MPTIEGHHDFAALERRLLGLLRETQETGRDRPFPPVAIIAPTRRLVTYLQVRLAETAGALLNVHFFHHQSLASAAVAAAGVAVPAPLDDDATNGVRTEILAALIQERGGPLAEYAAARPGTVTSILSSLEDLREAGVPAEAARETTGLTAPGRDLLQLHALFGRTLDRSGPALLDRAGRLRDAVPALRDFSRRFHLVVHYGAYDLIGVNLELLRAVEATARRLVYLTPLHDSSRAYERARRFWPEMLGARPTTIPTDGPSDRLFSDRLPLLFDETADLTPLAPPHQARVTFFHAQGAEAELREVALDILARHRDEGVALERVAVVARSLQPYAALLRPVFDGHALAFTTSATTGAQREPRVQASLQLARSVLGDFPRQPLLDLFRGGLLRLAGCDPSGRSHHWDALSRAWRVTGGSAIWIDDLPRWISAWQPYLAPDADQKEKDRVASHKEALAREAAGLASAVQTLRKAARPLERAKSWSAWAAALETLLRDHLDGLEGAEAGAAVDPGAQAVLGVLAAIRRLDATPIPFTGRRALALFERCLSRATVPIGPSAGGPGRIGDDNGGVRVLDAMQARGLSFDSVYFIGCNADLFPRRAVEDPFLSDADRRLLRDRYRVPLPIKLEAHEEERLLLAQILAGARVRLTVSWQRADESGTTRSPSLALREIARLVYGEPDTGRLLDAARRVKTHPAEAAEDALDRFRMLPPRDARVAAAFQSRSPAGLLRSLPALPADASTPHAGDVLRAGLNLLAAIDDWEGTTPGALRYDAFVGDATATAARLTPTRLETLGSCPQQYFFRHVLGVREQDEVLEDHEIDAREIGSRIHAVLQDAYRELTGPEGSFPRDEADRLLSRALALARQAWSRHTRDIAARTRVSYPLLWESTEEIWGRALERFLRRDLEDLRKVDARVLGLEREESARLTLGGGDGLTLQVLGRFDRITASREGVVVADYKTSGVIKNHVSLSRILKGTRLQLPVYLLLARALAAAGTLPAPPARGEILGVGPTFSEEDAIARLETTDLDDVQGGLLETLRVLLELLASGSFPLNDTSVRCASCPYRRACRRSHLPTVHRVTRARNGERYATLRRKNRHAPTLEQARQAARNGEVS